MIKKILRDNAFVNPIIRNCFRWLNNFFSLPKDFINKYRIFGIVKLKVNGVQFKVYAEADDFIANDLYYNVGYESGEFKLLNYLLLNCRNFVDVGANTGVFTIYAAICNENISVFSFEPHPANYKRLCKNIDLNGLVNVKPFSYAVGSIEQVIKFTVPKDLSISATSSANEGFTRNFHKIKFSEIPVQQVTLDATLAELNLTSNDLIKIDVEYYELEVLKGAVNILNEKRPIIMLEILNYNALIKQFPEMTGRINSNYGNEIFSFLIDIGYYGYAIHDDKISYVDVLTDNLNRNFLFMPYKLQNSSSSFDGIFTQGFQ